MNKFKIADQWNLETSGLNKSENEKIKNLLEVIEAHQTSFRREDILKLKKFDEN